MGAPDAAQDATIGSGGFLLSTSSFHRIGAVVRIVRITSSVVQLWKPCDVYLTQLELLMVLQALVTFPNEFRRCTGEWYIDNIASFMCLLKGRSDDEVLDHMSQLIHLLLFHLQCSLLVFNGFKVTPIGAMARPELDFMMRLFGVSSFAVT